MSLYFKLAPGILAWLRPSKPIAFLAPVKRLGYALALDSDKKEVIFDGYEVIVNYFGKLTRDGVGVPNEKLGGRVCIEVEGERKCEEVSPEDSPLITDGEGNYGFYAGFRLTTHVLIDVDVFIDVQTFTAEVESGVVRVHMPLRYCMGVKVDPWAIVLSLLVAHAPILFVSGVVIANEAKKVLPR